LTRALLAVMAVAISLPSTAAPNDGKDRSARGSVSVRIVISPNNDPNDARAFQHWYGGQMRGYDRVDPETGERYSEILQIVQEVSNGWLSVSNREDFRRAIVFNQRTKVVFQNVTPTWTPPGQEHTYRPQPGNNWTISRIRPGDLIIAEGYLHANGKFVSTRIRVIGHAWGYDDDYYFQPNYPSYEGNRAYGDVLLVDQRRNEVEVRANIGYRTLSLGRNGTVLINGRRANIQELRKGDRIVFYYQRDHNRNLEVYHIVRLDAQQAYPRDTERYWGDPNVYDYADNTGTWMEGTLDYISTGAMFNRMVLRADRGHVVTFNLPTQMTIIDYDGTRIPINRLREGEKLRVYYTDLEGTLFATKVVCR